jgi:hypothetical protein
VEAAGQVLRLYQCCETVGKIKELQYIALKPSRSPNFNLSHSLQEMKNGIIRAIANNSKQIPLCVEKYYQNIPEAFLEVGGHCVKTVT